MLAKAVRHFGITVQDIDDTVELFILLGFKEIKRGREQPATMKKVCGKAVKAEWVKMALGGSVIELIKYTPPIGVDFHVALTVCDIKKFCPKYKKDKDGRKIGYYRLGSFTLEAVE